ncbi:hypothetical protein MVEN_01703100 [Mycena venus]|uniref:Capsular polysaccharide assembling protein CapF C-terminal domain-containing protein n=1 Tax=Mycena venus TaxID=2733690 RepID=A0A8H6XPC1_9AGAR|nr:hypothetical protein MVEN_01703100 [Mycena venus]
MPAHRENPTLIVTPLAAASWTDARGEAVSINATHLDTLHRILDMTILTILPHAVRGNHFHNCKESFIVLAKGKWSLHFDEGPGTQIQVHEFDAGGTWLAIPPGFAHAIRNDAPEEILHLVGMMETVFDPSDPNRTVVKEVCKAGLVAKGLPNSNA